MTGLFYEVDEILNEAIMTGVPSIIVEGIDDISIYIDLSRHATFDIEVYAVEHIEGFGQGCDQVLKAIEALEEIPAIDIELQAHILGIIDKDVRDFRNELPRSPAILVLKHYSIESHFVSKAVIANTLQLCTKASQKMVTDQLCSLIMSEIENKLLNIYYHSLEALRNAIERNYTAAFAYSYSAGRLKDAHANQIIEGKRQELDEFAGSLQLNRSIESVKSIGSGKWLIEIFSDELFCFINGLQELCRTEHIKRCLSCMTNAHDKCLYRMKEGIRSNTIKSLAMSHVVGSEFDYIVDRILQLRPHT